MGLRLCLKILVIHLIAKSLAYASASSWAFQQIETEKAWELARSRGSNVLIAVIDTGVDIKHPDLKDSLWVNPGEYGKDAMGRDRSRNGLDDDKNGFVDDIHGWNFVSNSNDLTDDNGHGTHIAGIIAARNPSGFGIEGIAPDAKLMILKYYDPKAPALRNLQNTIRAFKYAIQMKVQIINFSGGGPGFNSEEEAVIKLAQKNNILLVAAAGNEGANTDQNRYYPADYELSNILSVTALNQSLRIPYYGNYGLKTVHLAAPGDQILSTLPKGAYGEMSGTSQATAFVTGAAALLLAQNPNLKAPNRLIEKLTSASTFDRGLAGKTLKSSRLNAALALMMKSTFESAAGFVFENSDEADSRSYTISSSLLDEKLLLPDGDQNVRVSNSHSF